MGMTPHGTDLQRTNALGGGDLDPVLPAVWEPLGGRGVVV